MQLTEDNSTISVKVNVFSYYCCRLKRENLENLKYPQIWNPARVLHFYGFFFASFHHFNDIPRSSLADDFWVFSWLSTCPPSWWTLWDTLQCTSNHSSLRPRFCLRIYNSWLAKIPLQRRKLKQHWIQVSVNLTVMLVLTTMFVRCESQSWFFTANLMSPKFFLLPTFIPENQSGK